VSRLLDRLGFNKLAERAGIAELLENAGFKHDASWFVGRLFFWLLMLTFFLSAAHQLGLTAIVVMLQRLVAFIPNVIAVVLIAVLGALFARFISGLVRGAAQDAGIEFADFLGRLVHSMVLVVVIVMAFTQLEIKSSMLEITFAILLGASGFGIALMLGMGSRTIAQNIVSGLYARRMFVPGQTIQIQNITGEILEVGTVSTTILKEDSKIITLPNTALIDEITERGAEN
jgi:small-conductance mechanosensitive channel